MATKIILLTIHWFTLLVLIFTILLPVNLFASANNKILVLRADGVKLAQTYQGIKDDLDGDFNLIEKIIDPRISTEESVTFIENYLDKINPDLIVLIGNTSARLYTYYQKKYPHIKFPPSMVVSALYVDRLLQQLENSQGIRHEIPAVTSISSIRSLLKQPIKRVGVLYRKWMRDYIKLNRNFCQKESIELISVEMSDDVSVKKLSYHLKHLLNKNIDALWVVNDNALISPQLVQNVWLPNIKEFNKPIIVGIEGLTTTALDFGTFSVVPDQYALGVQGAGLIGDILEEGLKQFEQNRVYEPLSVKKLLNINLMQRRNIVVNESNLESLDKLIR